MIVKKIKPLFTSLVTTMHRYADDEVDGKIITSIHKMAGAIKEYQTVVAVGTDVRNIAEGDIVKINPTRYEVREYAEDSVKKDLLGQKVKGYRFNEIELDGIPHLYLDQRDIEYVITEFEEEKNDSVIIQPERAIIV